MEILKTKTTPFRPSANGQVERFNRTLMDAVRCFVSKTPTKWDEYLPQIAGALRSAVNRSTGYTPNKLMLGREVNQPIDLVFPPISFGKTETDHDDYIAELSSQMTLAHKTARETLKTTQALMKRDYDIRTNMRSFKEGDVVYVLNTASVKAKCKKLTPTWKGPGVITRKITDYTYKILIRGKENTHNHDRIKLCNDTKIPTWILKYKEGKSKSVNSSSFCLCGGPDTGSFMIQCNECLEWFHGSCVNIDEADAKYIDIYECPDCIGS